MSGDVHSDLFPDWLRLARAGSAGALALGSAVAAHGGGDALRRLVRGAAALAELHPGIRAALDSVALAAVSAELSAIARRGLRVLDPGCESYPVSLLETLDPPPVLYLSGNPKRLEGPRVAVVGARQATQAGRATARRLGRDLAAAGVVVVSGLARGIDASAHRGALDAGGATVAVLGTGIDRVYPSEHTPLADAIAGAGVLLSEFPPGTPPRRSNFPRRNRIISGMCRAVVVVESALPSGSLVTARHALAQGREVMAVPGSVHNELARGCHHLLREGAGLVESAADVLSEIGLDVGREQCADTPHAGAFDLPEAVRQVLEAVDYGPTPVDSVVDRLGLTAEIVSSILFELECRGFVQSAPGGFYSRVPWPAAPACRP